MPPVPSFTLNRNLESCVRATKHFTSSGGNAYVGIDIVVSFGTAGKLQAYPCIPATVSDAADSTLSVTSVKRENDTYIIVFLNKAIASAFNIDLQFLVERLFDREAYNPSKIPGAYSVTV